MDRTENIWYNKYKKGDIESNEYHAIVKYLSGETLHCSTFIDEQTRTLGYGELDSLGTFEYELPLMFRIEMEIDGGTLTWKQYFEWKKTIIREKKLNRILR